MVAGDSERVGDFVVARLVVVGKHDRQSIFVRQMADRRANLRGPEIASNDFPGGGLRWIRRQEGVHTVIVNGEVTWTAADGYIADARAGRIATRA